MTLMGAIITLRSEQIAHELRDENWRPHRLGGPQPKPGPTSACRRRVFLAIFRFRNGSWVPFYPKRKEHRTHVSRSPIASVTENIQTFLLESKSAVEVCQDEL
jgi:hypothetical protein